MLTAACSGEAGSAESSPVVIRGTFSCLPDIREPEVSAAACPLTALESRNPAMSPSRNMRRKMPVFRLSMIVLSDFCCIFRFSFPQALIQPVIDMSILYNKIRVKETGGAGTAANERPERTFQKGSSAMSVIDRQNSAMI